MQLFYRWRNESVGDPYSIRFESYEEVVQAVEKFGLSGGDLSNLECLKVEPLKRSPTGGFYDLLFGEDLFFEDV